MSSEMKNGKDPMHKDGSRNMPGRHGSMQDNGTDNSTEAWSSEIIKKIPPLKIQGEKPKLKIYVRRSVH